MHELKLAEENVNADLEESGSLAPPGKAMRMAETRLGYMLKGVKLPAIYTILGNFLMSTSSSLCPWVGVRCDRFGKLTLALLQCIE
jgi:hypothetical protein